MWRDGVFLTLREDRCTTDIVSAAVVEMSHKFDGSDGKGRFFD
jgi:hypothetical protein